VAKITGSYISLIQVRQSKLIVLRSLCNFFKNAIVLNDPNQKMDTRIPTWQFISAFPTTDAFISFERMLDPVSSAFAANERVWKNTMKEDELDEAFIQHPLFNEIIGIQSAWSLTELSTDNVFPESTLDIDDTLAYPTFIAVCVTLLDSYPET
jgi:hypothetical protein